MAFVLKLNPNLIIYQEKIMARVNERGPKQDQIYAFKCTAEDRAAIKHAAMERGTNGSALIKELLIREKIIQPSYATPSDW